MPNLYSPVYLFITKLSIEIPFDQMYGNEADMHDSVHLSECFVWLKIEVKVTYLKVKPGELTIWLPEPQKW